MELIASFLVGFVFRAIVVEVFKFLIKLKKPPQLPAILVVGAVIYYYMLDDLYSDLEFINYVVIAGMFFPELNKIAIQIATLFEKKKRTA